MADANRKKKRAETFFYNYHHSSLAVFLHDLNDAEVRLVISHLKIFLGARESHALNAYCS